MFSARAVCLAAALSAASAYVAIELPAAPHPRLSLAAAELRRYFADLGVTPRTARASIVAAGGGAGAALTVTLAVAPAAAAAAPFYALSGAPGRLAVEGSDAQHALFGAYALLERLGMTFTSAGPTLPARAPDVAALAAALAAAPVRQAPVFTTRGLQPFHDFAEGPDWWGEDETKRVAEAIISMKGNMLAFHTYPLVEPAVWVGLNTSILPGGNVSSAGAYETRWATTLEVSDGQTTWGYNPLKSSDMGYGASQIFEDDCFGHETVSGNAALCPLPATPEDSAELFNRVGLHWQKVFAHSHALGVQNVLGTEMPLSMPPAPTPAPGAIVALQLWYSASRDDRFVSASACPECDGMYDFVGTTGWVLTAPAPGAVALSTCAGALPNGQIDNALVAGTVCPAGHGFIRIEGYAPAPGTAGTEPLTQYVNAATGHHWAGTAAYAANATAAGFAAAGVIASVFSTGPPLPSPPDAFDYYVGTLQRLQALLGDTLDFYWSWTPEGWEWNQVNITNPLIQDAVADSLKLQAAHEFVKPSFGLASCGWVVGPLGARWYYDTVLPSSWAISSIDMDVGNTDVDPAYANITHRSTANKWAIPWAEDDPGLTAPELWVNRSLAHAREAQSYGVGGLLSIHWRTRMTSPQIGSAHAVAWNLSLTARDYWQGWALGQFGDAAVAAAAAAIFESVDSFALPRPVDWIGGPGGMSASAGQCGAAGSAYGFVGALVALRPALLAALGASAAPAHLERFDYWAGQFLYMRSIAIFECSWSEYAAVLAAVKAIADPAARQAAARARALPARAALQANATEMVMNLLATVSSTEGAGTVYNVLSHSAWDALGAPANAALAALAGEPLPPAALPPAGYDPLRPPQARVPVARTMLAAGEPLRIRALVLAAPAQAPTSATLYAREHGSGGGWTATPLAQAPPSPSGVPRFVYTAALANTWASGVDWYLQVQLPANTSAYTAGGLGLAAGTVITADAVYLFVPPGGAQQPQSVIIVPN